MRVLADERRQRLPRGVAQAAARHTQRLQPRAALQAVQQAAQAGVTQRRARQRKAAQRSAARQRSSDDGQFTRRKAEAEFELLERVGAA